MATRAGLRYGELLRGWWRRGVGAAATAEGTLEGTHDGDGYWGVDWGLGLLDGEEE